MFKQQVLDIHLVTTKDRKERCWSTVQHLEADRLAREWMHLVWRPLHWACCVIWEKTRKYMAVKILSSRTLTAIEVSWTFQRSSELEFSQTKKIPTILQNFSIFYINAIMFDQLLPKAFLEMVESDISLFTNPINIIDYLALWVNRHMQIKANSAVLLWLQ